MDLYNQELMYVFHAKELSHPETFRQYTDNAVKEIKLKYGWDTEVEVNIEPLVKDKNLFRVAMSVFGLTEPIVIKKDGKQVMSVLRKVRKAVMRKIHQLNEKKVTKRKKYLITKELPLDEDYEDLAV